MEAAAIERDLPPRRGAAVGGLRSRNPWNINLIQTPSRLDKAFWDGDSDAGFEGESSRASDLRAAHSRGLYRNGLNGCSVSLCDELDHCSNGAVRGCTPSKQNFFLPRSTQAASNRICRHC